jgi:uncharacterized Tic20 family protein
MSKSPAAITPSSDERLMAALAHFLGLIGSLIIWAIQKDKSGFVRFQATQALAFDLFVMILMFVCFLCFFGLMFLGMFGTIFTVVNNATQTDSANWLMALPVLFPFGISVCIFPLSTVIFIIRIIAAISILNGNDFRYPWLGQQVEKFLSD